MVTRGRPMADAPHGRPGYGWLARTVQSPAAVVIFMIVSGLLQALYWIRQGGDFMHGRVLLTPLFCLLAPVAVIPLVLPDGTRMARGAGYLFAGATSVLWLSVVGWSLWAANSTGHGGRRHPRHVHRHRRRASVLRAGHRQRASADRRRLPRLSAHACGARRVEQHPGRRAAVAVGQLRPVGCGARGSTATTAAGRATEHGEPKRARTQCFSPTSACSA